MPSYPYRYGSAQDVRARAINSSMASLDEGVAAARTIKDPSQRAQALAEIGAGYAHLARALDSPAVNEAEKAEK